MLTILSVKLLHLAAIIRINQQSKLYARHEIASSLAGGFALNDQQQRNSTVVGVEGDYMKDGRVFSEYRVRDADKCSRCRSSCWFA